MLWSSNQHRRTYADQTAVTETWFWWDTDGTQSADEYVETSTAYFCVREPEPIVAKDPKPISYWPDVAFTKNRYARSKTALCRNPGGIFRGVA